MKIKHQWLTKELKEKVRKHFEPKYQRKLTDDEIVSIANSLTSFVEIYSKYKWRVLNEQKYAR